MNYKMVEFFTSIMGETRFIGYPSLFLRFYDCPCRCRWCDSNFSKDPAEAKNYSFESIIEEIKVGPKVVCFTGGEPLFQPKVEMLMEFAKDNGKTVVVYTNNAIPIQKFIRYVDSFSLDFKLQASGMRNKMLMKNLELLRPQDDFKFVVANRSDYEEALKVLETKSGQKVIKSGADIYMTPASNQMDPRILVRWVLEDKLYNIRVGYQLHKVIWGSDIRGV